MFKLSMFKVSALTKISILSSVFILAGCGAESDPQQTANTSAANNQTSVALMAEDITTRTQLGQAKIISLNDRVHLSSGEDFELVGTPTLLSDEAHCQLTLDNKTLSVSSDQAADCLYQYQVATRDASSTGSTASTRSTVSNRSIASTSKSAYLRVGVASTYEDNQLPVITKNLRSLSEQTINLRTELTAQGVDLTDFELYPNIIVLGGNGTAEIIGDDTIRFTPIEQAANINLVFSYRKLSQIENEAGELVDGYEIKLGNLVLSVSDTASSNNFPVANNFDHDVEVTAGTTVTIDVKGHINDADGDELQLVNVLSFNSTVQSSAPADFSNTKFTFYSSQPGFHQVTYSISDHQGGYDLGIVRILVEPSFALVDDWTKLTAYDDSIANDITFTAPLSQAVADYLNVNYASVDTDKLHNPPGSPIARFSYQAAKNFCSALNGRLPVLKEMNLLYEKYSDPDNPGLYQSENWPTANDYWIAEMTAPSSNSHARFVNLRTGIQSYTNITNASKYVTCVLFTEGVKPFTVTTTVEADPNIGTKYTITLNVFYPDGTSAGYQDVDLEVENKAGYFNSSVAVSPEQNHLGSTRANWYGTIKFKMHSVKTNRLKTSLLTSARCVLVSGLAVSSFSTAAYTSNMTVKGNTVSYNNAYKVNSVSGNSNTDIMVLSDWQATETPSPTNQWQPGLMVAGASEFTISNGSSTIKVPFYLLGAEFNTGGKLN